MTLGMDASATPLRLYDPERLASDHDLTVIIPAYNEESRLPKTLSDAKRELDTWNIDYRVMVVDDGSRDATASIASEFGERYSTLSKPNGGKGSAVRVGMMAATGRVIAFTDADLPYDLSALKDAYNTIIAGQVEVVFGSRVMSGSTCRVKRRWIRTAASKVFRTMMQILVSNEVKDTQCGLKVFSRSAARKIFSRTKVDGFAFDAEVIYLTHLLDLAFSTIPVALINEYSTTISLTRNAIPMQLDVLGVRLRALRGEYKHGVDPSVPNEVIAEPVRKAA